MVFKFLVVVGEWIVSLCKKISQKNPQRITNKQKRELGFVDCMDGNSFEYYVAELLRNNGYTRVRVTQSSGDFGVDIIAFKDRKKWVFQCKNYSKKLGVSPIQEVYSGATKYNADKAVVITNSFFTEHAKELARDLNVLLWDRSKLAKLMKTELCLK